MGRNFDTDCVEYDECIPFPGKTGVAQGTTVLLRETDLVVDMDNKIFDVVKQCVAIVERKDQRPDVDVKFNR